MDISILIVTYNSESIIEKCLKQLHWARDVIVIDNASTDSTVAIARQFAPHVRVVVNNTNLGFGRANNMAAELAVFDHLLFMNADIIITPDQLLRLLESLTASSAAMVGPLLINEDGQPELRVCTVGGTSSHLYHQIKDVPDGPACMVFLTGAVWLWQRQAWRQLGGFDPQIKIYWEDFDICLRAWRNHMPLVLVPDVRVTHLVGRSTTVSYTVRWIKEWNMTWGQLYILNKYASRHQALRTAWTTLGRHLGQSILSVLRLRRGAVVRNWAAVCGSLAYLRGKTPFSR